MKAFPRSSPLLARFRYESIDSSHPTRTVENAWWESGFDGGFVLGAVVEAMEHPRHPHRLRIHLRFHPDHSPREMEATLLRPDGEGRAHYRFEAEAVSVEGEWNGERFHDRCPLPAGYTVSPHCIAADGLHFRTFSSSGPPLMKWSYLLRLDRIEIPLIGSSGAFMIEPLGEEIIGFDGIELYARRFHTYFNEAPDRPADFWISSSGYPLRMVARRSDGTGLEVNCVRGLDFWVGKREESHVSE